MQLKGITPIIAHPERYRTIQNDSTIFDSWIERGYVQGDYPISEECSKTIFSIPMHPYLDRSNQDAIIEALNSVEK